MRRSATKWRQSAIQNSGVAGSLSLDLDGRRTNCLDPPSLLSQKESLRVSCALSSSIPSLGCCSMADFDAVRLFIT